MNERAWKAGAAAHPSGGARQLPRLCWSLAGALALAACAATAERPTAQEPTPAAAVTPAPQIVPGEALEAVREKLGPERVEREISPTERILSGIYGQPCDPAGRGPVDSSRSACGTGRLLLVRVRDGSVVSVDWGDPAGSPQPAK